jgi:hypothetical protein
VSISLFFSTLCDCTDKKHLEIEYTCESETEQTKHTVAKRALLYQNNKEGINQYNRFRQGILDYYGRLGVNYNYDYYGGDYYGCEYDSYSLYYAGGCDDYYYNYYGYPDYYYGYGYGYDYYGDYYYGDDEDNGRVVALSGRNKNPASLQRSLALQGQNIQTSGLDGSINLKGMEQYKQKKQPRRSKGKGERKGGYKGKGERKGGYKGKDGRKVKSQGKPRQVKERVYKPNQPSPYSQ